MSRSGGKKTEKNARGISANVAKFLYWCNPTEVETSQLTQAKQVRAYTAHLEGKIGPSGLQQHISDIEAGLRYLVETKEGTEEEERLTTLAGATSRKLKVCVHHFEERKLAKRGRGWRTWQRTFLPLKMSVSFSRARGSVRSSNSAAPR